jgi:hypothetical protein
MRTFAQHVASFAIVFGFLFVLAIVGGIEGGF